MTDTLSGELEALRDGRTSFAEFSADTADAWDAFARYLMRRWRAPAGVELVDVKQEMLVAAWRAVREWDPGRGASLRKFVVFSAMDKGKKWLHKQRQAGHAGDRGRSRHAVSFTELGLDAEQSEHLLERRLGVAPEQEERFGEEERAAAAAARSFEHSAELAAWRLGADRGRTLLRAIRELDERDRVAVAAIAACEGDVESAATLVARSTTACVDLRLGSDEAAERLVRGAAARLAEALAS